MRSTLCSLQFIWLTSILNLAGHPLYLHSQFYQKSGIILTNSLSYLSPFESLFILLMTSTSIFTLIILLSKLVVLSLACTVVSLCKKIASSSNPIIPKQTMPVPFNHVPSVSVSIIEEIKVYDICINLYRESSDSKNMKLSKYFNNVGRSKAKEIREEGS